LSVIVTPLGYQLGSSSAMTLSPGVVEVVEISSTIVRMVVSGLARQLDEAEEPVLNLVPLRRPGRVVAGGDVEVGLFGQSSQLDSPGPDPVAVGPTAAGGDEQATASGKRIWPISCHQCRMDSMARRAPDALERRQVSGNIVLRVR
jgi:hypothetical protein